MSQLLIATLAILFSLNTFAVDSSQLFDQKFSFTDETGKAMTLSALKGKRTVITMAYTECKRTCPMLTIAKLKELQEKFEQAKVSAEFVIISLDPDHDTPEVMSDFKTKKSLNRSNWHFVRTSKSDTRKVAEFLGLSDYWKMDEHIVHGFRIPIYSPEAKVEHVVDFEHQELEDYFKKVLSK